MGECTIGGSIFIIVSILKWWSYRLITIPFAYDKNNQKTFFLYEQTKH